MHRVLLLGAGKIGRMIARFLVDAGDFHVVVGDHDGESLQLVGETTSAETIHLDAADTSALQQALQEKHSVVSALSFSFNPAVAEAALEMGVSYFDLTEDVATTNRIRKIAEHAIPGQIFMPQCGLAPGFISIIANHLAQQVEQVETLRLRVGALPQFPTDAFKYNLTWSTDGLINEYCNPCDAIRESQRIEVLPLEGLEHFLLDGDRYEAFNTSGGLGTMCDTMAGRVRDLNYKTIRYIGHCDLVKFLVQDLRLADRRDLLKDILEHAIPITSQDVVITLCAVTGYRQHQLVQLSDARKIYCQNIGGEVWSAIQVTTAAGLCAVLDLHRTGRLPDRGFVKQEDATFAEFRHNRFGRRYTKGRLIAAGDDAVHVEE